MDKMQRAAMEPQPSKPKATNMDIPATQYIREIIVANIKAIPGELGSTLAAMFRAGAKDLRDFFLNPWQEQPLAHAEEPGMPLVLTGIEVTRDKHPEMYESNHHKSREHRTSEPMVVQGKELEI